MFGREARYPSEVPEEFMVDESVEDIVGQEELSEDVQKHQKLLELVKDNVVKAQEKKKGKIKMMKRDVVFKVGDKVLRANIRSQQRKGGKLEANFLGPFIITAIQDIMDAWAGKSPHVLFSKIGAYKLFYWDIQQIGPNMELESESINAYLAIMVRQCNRHNSAKAAFIDSFSMTAIWKRKAPRVKIKPMEHEVILGIVNEHHHWTLVVIYPQEKKSLYLDPLNNQQGHSCEKKDATSQGGLVTQSNTQNKWTLPYVESLH
ncbi:uncharacterized protein LOC120442792 [Oreochromis aureus]|uniref:uncharacterized protein LOC120442792 n=1 Tax=Oreochromis aureus TaxID=47969 RepID=UPI001954C1F4|nr:uncharacterized protein LOC120442792 [Oreochromis aureus]